MARNDIAKSLNVTEFMICLALSLVNVTLDATPAVERQTPEQALKQLLADAKHWRTFTTHAWLLGTLAAGFFGGGGLGYAAGSIVGCVANIPTPAGNVANPASIRGGISGEFFGPLFLTWSYCKWKAKQFETKANILAARLATSDKGECAKVIADLEAITAKDTQVYSWLHLPLNPLTPIVNYQRIIGHFNTQVRMTQALQKVYATAQARIKELNTVPSS